LFLHIPTGIVLHIHTRHILEPAILVAWQKEIVFEDAKETDLNPSTKNTFQCLWQLEWSSRHIRRVWRYQRVIRICKSKKDRQHNGQNKKD